MVTTAWTFVVLGADLKTSVYPNIHWLVSVGAVTCVLPLLLRFRIRPLGGGGSMPGLLPSCLLVLAVLLAGFGSPDPLYGIAEAAKLAIILVAARTLFLVEPRLAHYAVRGFVWAIAVNLVLLLLGLAGAGTAEELGPQRWGTLLNYPGSLARLGFLGLCYGGYMVLTWHQPLRNLALLASCATLIYFDGSRTTLLVLAALIPFLLLIRLTERKSALLSRFATLGVGVAIALIIITGWGWVRSQTDAPEGRGAIARIAQLAVNVRVHGATGLALADPVRARMLETGMEALRNASLIGDGIGTTRADTDVGLMVVHMTYLQIVGDLGLVGLVAYVWLVAGWVPWLGRAWRNIRALPDAGTRALHFNAIFLLATFALAGLFHPLSTEWSEWIMFIVPYALFWEVT